MTYQVLARKWRPKGFDTVVGQEPIVTALKNALREKRIAPAYLFSGIRGVGKTSVARILAKALNCERGAEDGPCNECDLCLSVDTSSNLDILEIDAATHSKVEQVRELTENLRYKPVRGEYKVVVLDEVHRLSRQAFDALLKIIEEPPAHLVFIFATTELESVPATILSRCQEFNFRRVSRQALVDHLAQLAAAEDITVGEKALRLIARASEGSVRDAVALLDQLATYGSGSIDDSDAGRILGSVDAALHQKVLAAMTTGDRNSIVSVVGEIENHGWDPRHVYGEFLSYCRDALHLALGGALEDVELPNDEAQAANDLAQSAGYENLLRLLHQLLASEEAVRRSEAGLLALEIAWLRGAELPRLTAIESLLSGSAAPSRSGTPGPAPSAPADGGGQNAAPKRRQAPPSPPAAKPEPAKPRTAPAKPRAAAADPPEQGAAVVAVEPPPPAAEPEPIPAKPAGSAPDPAAATNAAPAASNGDPEAQLAGIDGFLELIRRRRQVIAAHFADVELVEMVGDCLTIHTPPGDTWLELALRRDANRAAFEECLASAFGPDKKWRIVAAETTQKPETEGPPEGEPEAATTPESSPADTVLDHPTVQAALDVFGGTAETVEDRPD